MINTVIVICTLDMTKRRDKLRKTEALSNVIDSSYYCFIAIITTFPGKCNILRIVIKIQPMQRVDNNQ